MPLQLLIFINSPKGNGDSKTRKQRSRMRLLLLLLFTLPAFAQKSNFNIVSAYEKFHVSFTWYQSTIEAEDFVNGLNTKKVSDNNYRWNVHYLFNIDRAFFIGPDFSLSTISFKDQETLNFTNRKLRPLSAGLRTGWLYPDFSATFRLLYWEEALVDRISLSQVELEEEAYIAGFADIEWRVLSSENWSNTYGIEFGTGITEGFELDYKMKYDYTVKIGIERHRRRHNSFFVYFFYNSRSFESDTTNQTTRAIGFNLGGTWW